MGDRRQQQLTSTVNGRLKAEANAFDARIIERVNAGFIPDLRRAVKCDYFYKSFWRDPLFVDLYLGKINETYLELLGKYARQGSSVLDVGCGAGYMSLELARSGYHVTAFDISPECIDQAKAVLATNPFSEHFGSLSYKVAALHEMTGNYDVVLFSVSLHHMVDLDEALEKAKRLIRPGGLVLCYEPCHDRWTDRDAAQVALIRSILSITNRWHEDIGSAYELREELGFDKLTSDILEEYVEERDKNEAAQSPNDNEATGAEMLCGLRKYFSEIETRDGHSFIYRLLGGIRGKEGEIERLAKLLAIYDGFAVKKGYINPNGFYFIGRRT